MPDSTDGVLSCLGVSLPPWSEIIVSLGLCLDLSRSLDTKSAESDDKDRYCPAFTTGMLEVLGVVEQRGFVPVVGLLDLRKEKMDCALMLCEDLDGDGELVGT